MASTEAVCRQLGLNCALIKRKLTKASAELQRQIKAEEDQIYLKNRANHSSSAIPTEILGMHVRKINDWATALYSIYADVLQIQGKQKSAGFVRTVYHCVIHPLMDARKSAVSAELQQFAHRNGESTQLFGQQIQAFGRAVEKLDRDWHNDSEIEALEIEGRNQAELAKTAALNGQSSKSNGTAHNRNASSSKKRNRRQGKSDYDLKRESNIRAIIKKGKRGRDYCRALDISEIRPPLDWIKRGCPKMYQGAYEKPTWRKRIHDEKYRIRKSGA